MPPQLKAEVNIMPRVVQGNLQSLPPAVRDFIQSNAKLCQPESIHICDGSEEENKRLLDVMVEQGMIKKLSKYENWWVAWRKSSTNSELQYAFSILFTFKTAYNPSLFAFHEHFGTVSYIGEILRKSKLFPLKINIKHIIQLDYQLYIVSVD